MKTLKQLLTLAALCFAGIMLAALPPIGTIQLNFDYPASDLSNMTFRVYGSPTIGKPFTNWVMIATAAATNAVATNANGLATISVPVTIVPGQYFFICTASNFWGESDFSNVALTPPLPRSDSKLSILRVP